MDLQIEPEPAESMVHFEAGEERHIPTEEAEIPGSRQLRTFKDSWRLQEIEGEGEGENLNDPLGQDKEGVEFEPVSEADVSGARKPHLDREQVISEVREVFLTSKTKTLGIHEICKKIRKPKNEVKDILAKSALFTTVGFSIWKLAEEEEETQLQNAATEARVIIDLEQIWCALSKLGLKVVECGEYLVIMKSEFDVMLHGEPYHALLMLFNVHTGKFMARVWNKSETVGKASTLAELKNACIHHFRERRLCLGLLEDEDEQSKHSFLISQTPVSRKISRACTGMNCIKIGHPEN